VSYLKTHYRLAPPANSSSKQQTATTTNPPDMFIEKLLKIVSFSGQNSSIINKQTAELLCVCVLVHASFHVSFIVAEGETFLNWILSQCQSEWT